MKISEHLKKPYWTRRVTPDSTRIIPPAGNSTGYEQTRIPTPGVGFINLTSDDFLNEIAPQAHEINSRFMSQRPIYGPTDRKNDKGETEWEVVGYDDIETVSLGLQEMIISKKIAHLTGNNFWVSSETEDEDAMENFNSWADYAGLWDGYREAVYYCERCGDSALYLYQDGENRISYEVLSYEKGQTLYPGYDENGNPNLFVSYKIGGKDAVDIYTTEAVETWVKVDASKEDGQKWYDKMMAWLRSEKSPRVTSEDNYTRIRRKEAQVGSDILQVIYFKVPDIATGPVQDCICKYEKAHSFIAEESKASAFPILFLKSEKIMSLPPSDIAGKVLGVKGTTDQLQHSSAEFLTPPNSSDIAKIHLETLKENILRGSMTALVEPEILKQGSDSSTTIKIMFTPDIQWCMNRWHYYAKPVRQLVEVFKRLVGKVEGEIARYGDLRISCGQEIWLPVNEAEQIKIETDQYYAGLKSRKAAMADIGNSHKGDAAQIMKEKEEEKALDAKYNTTTKTTNPEIPDVTNQAENQPRGK